jgi:hypothetical protein
MHLSSFLFQITLSQEDFSKVMQVLKENFAEGTVVEPTTRDTAESEKKWTKSKKPLERPSTLEGIFVDFFYINKWKVVLPLYELLSCLLFCNSKM